MLPSFTLTHLVASSESSAPFWFLIIAGAAVLVTLYVVGLWKVFQKAGKPGWASIVPFYNSWVLAEIAGKPGWWGLYFFLNLIPLVGGIAALVISIFIADGLGRSFGKSYVFSIVGLWFFSIVGYLMLGFGDATYKAPAAAPDGLGDWKLPD